MARMVSEWQGEMRFSGGVPDGPTIVVDGDGKVSPSPVITLLIALAGCTGSDMVSILEKMQVKLKKLVIETDGTRATDYPRRFTAIHLTVRVAGEGLDETKARRSIDLSLEKYCSVAKSLDPNMPITYDVVIE